MGANATKTVSILSPEWLTSVMNESGAIHKCRISSVECIDIGRGIGFMGQIARLVPTYEPREAIGPRTLIAKLPITNGWIREWVDRSSAGERESSFYRFCGSPPGVKVPVLYYAGSTSTGETVLLLEDLGSTGGCNYKDGLQLDTALRFVTRLARFHAWWWESSQVNQWSWLPSIDAQAEPSVHQYEAALKLFMRGALVVNRHMINVCDNLGASLINIKRRLSAPPITLLHGDLQPNNILLPANPDDVILLDWQACCRGRAMCDLAYFMILSLQSQIRFQAETVLIETYRQELSRHNIEYPIEQCLNDYKLATLNVLHFVVCINYLLMLSNDPTSLIFRDVLVERISSAVVGYDSHNKQF